MCVQDKLPLKDCNAQDTSCLYAPSGQNSGVWQGQWNPDCFGLLAEGEGFWQLWLPDLSNSRCSLKGGMAILQGSMAGSYSFSAGFPYYAHFLEELLRFESHGNHAAPNLQGALLWHISGTIISDRFGSQPPSSSPRTAGASPHSLWKQHGEPAWQPAGSRRSSSTKGWQGCRELCWEEPPRRKCSLLA